MKHLLILVLCCSIQAVTIAQPTPTNKQTMEQLGKQQKELAETMDNLKRRTDSLNQVSMQKRADYETGVFMKRLQEERVAKQKRKMWLYIGLGVFFLVVLIVGLRRKTVKKG